MTEPDHIIRLRSSDAYIHRPHHSVLLDALALLADYDRLRLCLTGVASCSSCPACSGAAKRTLEGTT